MTEENQVIGKEEKNTRCRCLDVDCGFVSRWQLQEVDPRRIQISEVRSRHEAD